MYLKKHTFQKFGEVLYKVHENKVGILQEIDSSTFYINSEISVICARECNHLMELDTSIMGVQQERRKIKFPFPQFGVNEMKYPLLNCFNEFILCFLLFELLLKLK
ncbi:hypothetical protein ACP275_08G103700 [Erythranthe tilingii]